MCARTLIPHESCGIDHAGRTTTKPIVALSSLSPSDSAKLGLWVMAMMAPLNSFRALVRTFTVAASKWLLQMQCKVLKLK